MIYTIQFNEHWAALGMEPGQYIAVNSHLRDPFHVIACRPLVADYGAMFCAVEAGAAELITPGLSFADLASAVGWPLPPAPPPSPPLPRWTRSRRGHLYRLK